MNRSRFSVGCLEQSFPEGIMKPSDGKKSYDLLVMRRLISYLQFVLLFELNGSLTRVHLQGLILWALLEVVTSLWPRKVGLRDLF